MAQPRIAFKKDHEDIVQKFGRLLAQANDIGQEVEKNEGGAGTSLIARILAVRASALNLLARTAGEHSIYYLLLKEMHSGGNVTGFQPGMMIGVIEAAMTDFREGFMADTKLLVSAEVLADFLVQAEVLLEHDYKDAAAVIIRAVLEDALRRVCISNALAVRDRAGIAQLTTELAKQNLLTAVQAKEIEAKKEIGNKAAHGRFDEYTREDVVAFHEFVQRLLATII